MQLFLEYRQYIKKLEYEVYKYFFPIWMEKRLSFLSHAFYLMDDSTPLEFKRRKDASENIESAVMILARLEQILNLEIPMIAGSKYLNPKPWAVLGDKTIEACHTFKTFSDIINFYCPRIKETNSFRGHYANFRISSNLPCEIASRNEINPHVVVSIAVCLACDIIRFCGPDCDVLFDFFSNDLRETEPNIKKWEMFRIKMFGEIGKIKEIPYTFKVGQLSNPPIPLISNIFFEEVETEEMAEGEESYKDNTLLTVEDLDRFFIFDE